MDTHVLIYFLIALTATFVGAIPFGPINLSVVNTTLTKSFRSGFQISFAASIVEIFEASAALFFGVYIDKFLMNNNWIQVVIFLAFIGLGVHNLTKVTHPKLKERTRLKVSDFAKGLIVAISNPQAIPFWIFTLAFISQQIELEYFGVNLGFFLAGVFVGKLLALLLFGLLSNFLKPRLQNSCKAINRSFGAILVIIGLLQAFKYFTS